MKPSSIVRSLALTVVCLLATKLPSSAQNLFNLAIPNYSFTSQPANVTTVWGNQNPIGDVPYPKNEMFTGWETTVGNYQTFLIGTGAYTGTFQGSSAAYINGSFQPIEAESLNPVTTIIANATYTLTFALMTPGGSQGATLSLLATTQGADPNLYANGTYPSGINSPFPLIATTGTLATTNISAGTLNGTAGVYNDYSVSFNTLNGNNSAFVGSNLSIDLISGAGGFLSYDNARLTELAIVPEPSTWALMLAGVAGLFFFGRRKLKV
jgi:hypothetical protein